MLFIAQIQSIRNNLDRLLGKVKLTDGTNDLSVDSDANIPKMAADTDDDGVDGGQKTLLVVCLNYVWDSGQGKWVRMTQP